MVTINEEALKTMEPIEDVPDVNPPARQMTMGWAVEDEVSKSPDAVCRFADCPSLYGNLFKMTDEVYRELINVTRPSLLDTDVPHGMPPEGMTITRVGKAQVGDQPQPTNLDLETVYTYLGIPHPVDFYKAKALRDISPHHSSCIQAKLNSAVGLGFISEGTDIQTARDDNTTSPQAVGMQVQSLLSGKSYVESNVDKALNPLTLTGFANELYSWVGDFLDCGTGYLEVVRDEGESIVGINWIPVQDMYVYVVRDEKTHRAFLFYRYVGEGIVTGYQRYFSLFGKKNRKLVQNFFYADQPLQQQYVSEVIPLYMPTNRSKYYGYPDWLSAAPMIDLLRRALQYKSDWFVNRGVLDYIFHIAGSMQKEQWDTVVSYINQSVGTGNKFKALAIKTNQEATSEVHHLSGDNGKEDQFWKDLDTFSQFIVSAHRVPPVLANILIPGKLGASNETVQALVAFQLLVCGPIQKNIERTLAQTLGGEDGIPELKAEDFRLVPITSQFNITGMDAVATSRSEAMDGQNSGRDYSKGTKD